MKLILSVPAPLDQTSGRRRAKGKERALAKAKERALAKGKERALAKGKERAQTTVVTKKCLSSIVKLNS